MQTLHTKKRAPWQGGAPNERTDLIMAQKKKIVYVPWDVEDHIHFGKTYGESPGQIVVRDIHIHLIKRLKELKAGDLIDFVWRDPEISAWDFLGDICNMEMLIDYILQTDDLIPYPEEDLTGTEENCPEEWAQIQDAYLQDLALRIRKEQHDI